MTRGPCPAAWTASSHWRDRSSLELEVGMRPSRRILGSLVLASVLAIALAANTLASGPYTYTLSGFETSLTTTQTWCNKLAGAQQGDVSTFAGVAASTTTGASGTWSAKICHSHLTATTTIYGGSFSYAGTDFKSIAGNFSDGTVTQTSDSSGCTKQTYSVTGSLTLTAPTTGTGSFGTSDAPIVLTHYRTLLFGRWCIVYAATVTGPVKFSF